MCFYYFYQSESQTASYISLLAYLYSLTKGLNLFIIIIYIIHIYK